MSPEQAMGRDVDSRSDLFSLGVLLIRVRTHQPPSVRKLNPEVPRVLSMLVDRLLEKDSAQRPQSAAAVAAELSDMRATDPSQLEASRGISGVETVDPDASTYGDAGTPTRTPGSAGKTDAAPVVTLRTWPPPNPPEQP